MDKTMTPTASPARDVDVVVHVGLHKTGTTWLQERIFQPNADTAFVYSEDRRLIRGHFFVPLPGSFDADATRAAFRDLLTRAAREGKPLLLSDELLGDLPFSSRNMNTRVVERLKRVFPRLKIILTIREQASVIYSTYGHYLRAGFRGRLDEFLLQPTSDQAKLFRPILNLNHFDYDRSVRLYGDLVGPENLLVLPMERMLRETRAMTVDLETFMTCAPLTADPEIAADVANPALSDFGYHVLRVMNGFQDQETRHLRTSRGLPNKLAYKADTLISAKRRKASKARSIARIESCLGDRFAVSNRRVARQIGVDLLRYGYRVAADPQARDVETP